LRAFIDFMRAELELFDGARSRPKVEPEISSAAK
jgi:hypothetical protein